jgi:aminoglycoside phosphotransferase (APT) family kinase protein
VAPLDESAIDDRLLAYLRSEIGSADVAYADSPTRLPGGNETFIYSFSIDRPPEALSGPLVLRAFRAGYARPDQARWEATVQNALAEQGYPAAQAPLAYPDADVLGTPFFIMKRLPGTMLLQGISDLDDAGQMHFGLRRSLGPARRLLREIPRVCAEAQIRLHALDPQRLLDAFDRAGLAPRTLTFEGRLDTLRAWVEEARVDGLERGLSWLVERQPAPERLVICHCDTQPNNILMDGSDISGVVDWSQALVADPALDVGYTKMAFETVPLQLPQLLHWVGRPMQRSVSRQYLSAYLERRPLNMAAVAYYGVVRALFALALISRRRLTGQKEPDIWDSPAGIKNLVTYVHAATGIAVTPPAA